MNRCAFGLIALLLTAAVQADEITYWTDAAKKQSTRISGTITKEEPDEILIKTGFKETERGILARHVIDVVYSVESAPYKEAVRLERTNFLKDALRHYENVKTSNSAVARQVQWKVAALTAQLAKEDRELGDLAVDRLTQFRKDHGKVWQGRPCLEALAELYASRKEHTLAAKAHDELAKWPGLTATMRGNHQRAAVQALLRAGEHGEAAQRLTALLKDAPDDQLLDLRLLLAVCRANTNFPQAIRDLEALLDQATDPRPLAMIHNTLGDCYQLNNQAKEAIYHYLFVDLIYQQDKTELARAYEQLTKLFRQLKQPDRAQEYAERLAKLRG